MQQLQFRINGTIAFCSNTQSTRVRESDVRKGHGRNVNVRFYEEVRERAVKLYARGENKRDKEEGVVEEMTHVYNGLRY